MKLFGFNITKSVDTPSEKSGGTGMFAFSTPFGKIGKADLTSPYISKHYTVNNIVRFGEDNLYPQLLNQLYHQSPINGACIDFIANSIIGGGIEWVDTNISASQKVEELAFSKKNKLKKLARQLTLDYIIHKRVCVEITKVGDKQTKLRRLDPSTIRNYSDLSKFVYSEDWSRGNLNSCTYDRYDERKKQDKSIYIFQEESPGQDVYPIPTYNSVLNWAYLDSQIPYLHKSSLQNGVYPSLAIRRPKDFQSLEEVRLFKEEISSKTGPSEGGKVLVLTGNGFDEVPDIVKIETNSNDKAFELTSKELKENISMAHKINPSIMGVKTAGQLGATTEIRDSYLIFEKNVVMPGREVMEEILNDLVDIAKIKNVIKINDYQIIDGQILQFVEKNDDKKTI